MLDEGRSLIRQRNAIEDRAVELLAERPDYLFRDKSERYIVQDRHNPDLRRKAYTAIAAKMARTIHAVIKAGEPYRPFFEGVSPRGRTSLS